MSAAYSLDVGSLTTVTCGVSGCGIAFAIPTAVHTARKMDGGTFYCPNGHKVGYNNSETERLKRDLAQTQKRLEWERTAVQNARTEAKVAEKRRRATKGALTKVKQRAARGCCPFCSAIFPNLAAHVEAKHGKSRK
jgi:hypothetical protein